MSYPILYEADERQFKTMGLGALPDAIECIVTEERNGAFELEMLYPVGGLHYAELEVDRIILAPPNDTAQWQPFRIYGIYPSSAGTARVAAEHISYQLNHIGVAPYYAPTAVTAIAGLKMESTGDNPFNFTTDILSGKKYTQIVPSTIRARLGGEEGSLIDTYGGELEFDRYSVRLHAARGEDRGIVVAYSKNITTLEQEISIESMCTAIYPYYYRDDTEAGDTLVQLPERYVSSGSGYSYHRIKVVDFTSDFDDPPTPDQLRNRARSYLNANRQTVPTVSILVQFSALWHTAEYASLAPLERVNLCDTVTVRYPKLGVDATAKVIRTEYDVLRDKYSGIELGNARQTLDGTIADLIRRQNT